jgi:tellurite resistance protein TerC
VLIQAWMFNLLQLDPTAYAYGGFVALVLGMLALDLGVFHRKAHEVSFREALAWSVVWVCLGVGFAVFVYFAYEHHWLELGLDTPMYDAAAAAGQSPIVIGTVGGAEAMKQYLTGYVVEKSLAMDNIFVIAMVFSYFLVPRAFQHRVLFWGIIGALVMRGLLIGFGAELIVRYTWLLIGLGLFLLYSAGKMAIARESTSLGSNRLVGWVRRVYPVTEHYDGQRFFTVVNGVRHATPLLLALLVVEVMDVIFAVDSIPAIFAITPDPFIVFTSNIMAILGLRALYFCLAAALAKFRYLKPALVLILAFVGVKLLLLATPPYLHVMAGWLGLTLEPLKSVKLETAVSLVVVLGLLGVAVVMSILLPQKQPKGVDS